MKKSRTAIVFQALKLALIALLLTLAACSSPEEKAEAHLQRGQEFLSTNDYTSAGLEFRSALKFNEKLTAAWLGLSEVLEQSKNWRGVANSLTKALELDTNLVKPRVKLGRLLLLGNSESVEKALSHVNKANELKANDPDVIALRAAILYRLADHEGARRDARRALELNPNNTDAYGVLAADKLRDNDTQGAIALIDKGLAAQADSSTLLQLKARIFEQTRDDTNLELVMRKLMSFNPDARIHRLRLVQFLSSRKRLGEAEAELRILASENPDDTTLNLQLIRFLRTTKGNKDAQTELASLIEKKPQVADYKLALAELMFAEDGIDASKGILGNLISKNENEQDVQRARVLLARMSLQSNRTEDASKLIEETLAGDEKNSDALALRATINLEANNTEKAVTDLREALAQQPRSVGLLHLLGKAFEQQGAPELAEDNYERAVQLSNYASKLTMEYVAFLSRREKDERIEQVLDEAVRRNPSPMMLTTLARLRLRKQDWSGAVEIAKQMKERGIKGEIGDLILGEAQLGQKQFDAATTTFEKIYSRLEGDARRMWALVRAHVQSGNHERAEEFLQSVLEANPSSAPAHILMGRLRLVQKKPEEAEAEYKKAIEHQPKSPTGYIELSRLYASQKKFEDADAVIVNAIEQQPKNPNLHQFQSQLYISQKKMDVAESILQKAFSSFPGNMNLGLRLAGIQEKRRDFEAAIKVYEALLEKHPRVPILLNNLASLLAEHRDDEESLERAQSMSALLRNNNIPHFKDTVGWISYKLGDYRIALSTLKEAAEALPNEGLVLFHLGMTYAALEKPEDAKQHFTEALKLATDDAPLTLRISDAMAKLPNN